MKKFVKHYQQRRIHSTDVYSTIRLWQENGWSYYNEHKEPYHSILQFVKVTTEHESIPLPPDFIKIEKDNKCHII